MYIAIALALGAVLRTALVPSHTATEFLRSGAYKLFVHVLLAIGLYGSVHGIEAGELRRHRGIIVSSITLGVVTKAFLIGGALWLYTRQPVAFLLGVAVAQIDPLSVAAMERRGGAAMSGAAKTIIRAWSSFDDPVTVLLAVYVGLWISENGEIDRGLAASHAQRLIKDIALNLALAGTVWLLARLIRAQILRYRPTFEVFLLLLVVSSAAYYRLMLGVAVVGLILRPNIKPTLDLALSLALLVSSVLAGFLLVNGVWLLQALVLGGATFLAQVAVGYALAAIYKLPTADKVHLSLAQQNGITAIILAITMNALYPPAVGTIVPALIVINVVHWASNAIADSWLKRRGMRSAKTGNEHGVR